MATFKGSVGTSMRFICPKQTPRTRQIGADIRKLRSEQAQQWTFARHQKILSLQNRLER